MAGGETLERRLGAARKAIRKTADSGFPGPGKGKRKSLPSLQSPNLPEDPNHVVRH